MRAAGATHIAVVMSPNFVQRGEPAVFEKRLRARCALLCGVDLVLELPLPYAMATAQRFARGAVGLLQALGCVDTLCFGSETADLALLWEVARMLELPPVAARLREGMAQGLSFAAARQQAVAEHAGREAAAVLGRPNSILAVEYLRSLTALGSTIRPVAFPRRGAAHHDSQVLEGVAAGGLLRRRLGALGAEGLRGLMPAACFALCQEALRAGAAPCSPQRLQTAVLARLRALSRQELAALPDLSEGIEHRLYRAVRQSTDLEALCRTVVCKRYPLARARRLVYSAYLGVERDLATLPPPYLRVLGMNGRGRELLAAAKGRATLPLSVSLAALERAGGDAARFARLEAAATDQFVLGLPQPLPCGTDYTDSAVLL